MTNASTPLIDNINKDEFSNININNINNINKSEIKYKNNNINNISISKEENKSSMEIINPFDSIISKKIKLSSNIRNNQIINKRYSQNSIINSLSNSNGFKIYNNFSYSLSSNITNKEKNTINESNDINFEIIKNEEASNFKNNSNNYKSSFSSSFNINSINNINNSNSNNKKIDINVIKESEEEDNEENNNNYLGEIHLDDLELYVDKFSNNKNENKYNNIYENKKRLSDIINNSPFDNINIVINKKTREVDIDKLITISNIVYIKSLENEQITEKFDEDFYSQILSAKKFSNLNEILHTSENFESCFISVTQLYTYNGKNKNLKEKKIRDITSNDGDSFIKAFIFNYMENIIVNLYINKIIFIIYIISTKLSLILSKDIELNLQEILTVLKIIYTHMKKNNTKEAYIVHINAFKENSEYEKGLIYFIKYCIQQFIIDNHILFNLDYLNELIIDRYVNILNNEFDYKLYIEEKILPIKSELQYEIVIYYILPLIFDINLIIYTNNKITPNKYIFKTKSKKNEIIKIELNIKFGNTSIIYNDLFFNKYKNIIPYFNDNINLNNQIEKIKEKNNCKKCDNDIYIKLNKKIKPICQKCFIEKIKKVINKRYIYLKQDLFMHEEFYCSKIKLTNALENNIYLNDIKKILENDNDITEEIYEIIIDKEKCDKCNQNFKLKKYSICLNECGHIICDKCFIKYINDITHKRIILNKFELNTESLQYICPCCNNIIHKNINFYIYKYFDNIESYINQSNERLYIQLKRFCSKCKKICNEYFFEINELTHTLCNECKKFLDAQKKLNDKRSVQTKFMCIFCEENHNYNLLHFSRNKNKEKYESCCIFF